MDGKSQSQEVSRALALSRCLTVIGLVAVSAITISTGITLYLSHRDATHAAASTAENVRTFVTSQVGNNLEALETALQDMRDALMSPAIMNLPESERRRLLMNRADRTRYHGAMAVVDAQGEIRGSSSSEVLPAINVADRDYFTVQRDHPPATLYISRPFISRAADKAPSLAVTLRRSDPDGRFDGIVIGVMKLAYLQELLKVTHLGDGGQVLLLRSDGVVLMRNRADGRNIDTGIDRFNSPIFQTYLKSGGRSFDALSPTDGQNRRYIHGVVPGMPLVVSVSQNIRDIYREWNRRAVSMVAVTALSCIAIITLTTLFRRELLRRAQAEAELCRLATVDALTGIANRRQFDAYLEREWRRAGRIQAPLGLLMVDVDRFKAFNDKYGHWVGDELLIAIAGSLAASVNRPGDLVARYGGEEFAVILPDTDTAGVMEIGERLRAAVEVTTAADATGRLLRGTVSIGAASLIPGARTTSADLIRAADAALYRAKESGRNTVAREPAPSHALRSVAVAG